MRRKIAIGTLGFMILLVASALTWAQDAPPKGPGPGPAEHHFGAGGPHGWGEGPQHCDGDGPGPFGGPGMGGPGGHGGMHEFGGGSHLLRMAENPHVRMMLGLTDDQVARLHRMGVDAEKSAIQTRADMELRHLELRELLRADNPQRDAIMQKIDEVTALRGKMEKQRIDTLLSARGVLTPEQVKKVKSFMENGGFHRGMEERGRRMEFRGERGHNEHGGPGAPPPGPLPPPPPVQ